MLLPDEVLSSIDGSCTNVMQLKPLLHIFAFILLRILTFYRISGGGCSHTTKFFSCHDLFAHRDLEFELLFEDEHLYTIAFGYLVTLVEFIGYQPSEDGDWSCKESFEIPLLFSKYPNFIKEWEERVIMQCLTESIRKSSECPVERTHFTTNLTDTSSSDLNRTVSLIMRQIQQLSPAKASKLRQILLQVWEWRYSIRKSHPAWPKQHKLRQRMGYPGSKDALYAQTFSKVRNVVGTVLGVLLMGLFLGVAVWMRIGAWENHLLQDDLPLVGAEFDERLEMEVDCIDFGTFDRETKFIGKQD
jgi:hypothetical protein